MSSTFRRFDEPSVTQFSVFLKNRVGELNELTSTLAAARVAIHGMSVWDATDHAVVRLILSDPPWAYKTLREHNYAVSKNELVAVSLPIGDDPIGAVARALLEAEVNIHYSYPLFHRPLGKPVILLHCDDVTTGIAVLARKGFDLIHHGHLRDDSSDDGPSRN